MPGSTLAAPLWRFGVLLFKYRGCIPLIIKVEEMELSSFEISAGIPLSCHFGECECLKVPGLEPVACFRDRLGGVRTFTLRAFLTLCTESRDICAFTNSLNPCYVSPYSLGLSRSSVT